MKRTVAALLGIVGMSVRVTLAYQPVAYQPIDAGCCQPVTVCCEPAPMVECCLPPSEPACCEPTPGKPLEAKSAEPTLADKAPAQGAETMPAPPEPSAVVEKPAATEPATNAPTESSVAKPVSPPPLAVPAISPTPAVETFAPPAAEAPAAAGSGNRYADPMDDPLADPLRRGATPAAEAPAAEAPPAEEPVAEVDVEEAFTESPAEPQPEPEPQPAVPPASEPMTEPAAGYDLFGEPAAATPTKDPVAAPVTEAAAEPAAETPAVPETPPAEEPAAPAEPDAVDLFGEPAAAEPATETPAEAPSTPAAEPANADEANEEPKEEQELDFDSLFGPSSSTEVLTEPGGWASDAARQWNDAEGADLATARLTAISDSDATLLTDAGQTLNVSFAQLSDSDLAFLRRQIDARQIDLTQQQRAESRLAEQSR